MAGLDPAIQGMPRLIPALDGPLAVRDGTREKTAAKSAQPPLDSAPGNVSLAQQTVIGYAVITSLRHHSYRRVTTRAA
jgi:hypothetical protein